MAKKVNFCDCVIGENLGIESRALSLPPTTQTHGKVVLYIYRTSKRNEVKIIESIEENKIDEFKKILNEVLLSTDLISTKKDDFLEAEKIIIYSSKKIKKIDVDHATSTHKAQFCQTKAKAFARITLPFKCFQHTLPTGNINLN